MAKTGFERIMKIVMKIGFKRTEIVDVGILECNSPHYFTSKEFMIDKKTIKLISKKEGELEYQWDDDKTIFIRCSQI